MVRLYELRMEQNLSQRELAKKLNISQGTYNNWENGKTEPSIEDLIEISKLFKVSVDYLIGNQVEEVLMKEDENTLRKIYRSIQKLDEETIKALSVIIEKMAE